MSDAANISEIIETAIANQRGNSIDWGELKRQLVTITSVPLVAINVAKVSSRDENFYVRLNQTGFRKPQIKLGVLVSVGQEFTKTVRQRLASKVSPSAPWPLIVFYSPSPNGPFTVTDLVCGPQKDAKLVAGVHAVWPETTIHEYAAVWGEDPRRPHTHAVNPSDRGFHLVDLLRARKNVVLEGVPGTGKSYALRGVSAQWKERTGRDLAQAAVIVLHPSSAYEDLIEGLRPGSENLSEGSFIDYPEPVAEGSFAPHLGRFTEACRAAAMDPSRDYLLVLDELNRCNVPKALGELMLVMDRTKRAVLVNDSWYAPPEGRVRLTYTGVEFWIPSNLHILGTMNTTDRSTAPLDAALRRRFDFVRLEPLHRDALFELLQGDATDDVELDDFVLEVLDVWAELNDTVLRPLIGPDAVLGHSYIFELAAALALEDGDSIKRAFLEYTYLPQLIESVANGGCEDAVFGPTDVSPNPAVTMLRALLARYDLTIEVVGTGLGRKIVVQNARSLDASAMRSHDPSDPA